MHYFGHHVNLVSLLYVPAYWLGAGPHFLYLTETMALAGGAIPVWLLSRDRLATHGHEGDAGWWALIPAAALLLYPALEWMNWWHWHPETMAITPLLFAWWFASRRRWGWFTASVVLALSTKEDVALAILMLGLVLLIFRRERKRGALTALAGATWFGLCTQAIIPALLGGQPFYAQQLFPEFGDSLGSVLIGMLTHPGKVLRLMFEGDRLTYYFQMLGPLGVVAILGLPMLLIAGPQVGINALSSLPGTHDIRFQYSAVVVAAVFIAGAEGIGLLHRWSWRVARGAVAVMAVTALLSNAAWSPSPLSNAYNSGIWAKRIPRHVSFDRAVALVPDDAGVSASYYLIPHLTHRKYAYEWPNPWILGNWGLPGEPTPAPTTADYIVLDLILGQEPALLAQLTEDGGDYEIIFEQDDVLVARRR
jgi:uncharacterized membrane protein